METQTTIKVRKTSRAAIVSLSEQYGLTLVQTVDVAIAAFRAMKDTQKFKAMKDAAAENRTRK